jgi:hypothetical protein
MVKFHNLTLIYIAVIFSFCHWSLEGMRRLDTLLPAKMQNIEILAEVFPQY